MSDNMKDLRGAENKYDHTSGPTPFNNRALAHKNSKAPHIEAYMALHQKNAPHIVAKLKKAMDTHLAIEQVNQSLLLDGTVHTEESTVCLPKDKEIVVFEEVLGPSKGTMVHGMDGVKVRNSKKRGPAKGCLREVEETHEVIKKLQGVVDQNSKEIEVMKAALEKEHNERKIQESLIAEKFKEMYAMMAQMGQARGGGDDGNGGLR